MADNNNTEAMQQREELARKRLLKANDAQRRKLEKMVDEIARRAAKSIAHEQGKTRVTIQKKMIRDTMGEDLERILALRDRILSLDQQLGAERAKQRELVADAQAKYGLTCYIDSYYVSPKPKAQDVCDDDPDLDVQFIIRECRSNPTYAEFEALVLPMEDERIEFDLDVENLRLTVWQAVTTDEIVEAIRNFREKWGD